MMRGRRWRNPHRQVPGNGSAVETSADADALAGPSAAAAAEFPGADISFQVTGNLPINISSAQSNRANELKYQAIGLVADLAPAALATRTKKDPMHREKRFQMPQRNFLICH